MNVYYVSTENEILDLIFWKHYGYSSGAVEEVLLKNPGLAEYKSFLLTGLKIKLPTIHKTVQKSKLKVWE